MPKWVYKIMPLQFFEDPMAAEMELNRQGQETWEVITIHQHGNQLSALMKRPGTTLSKPAPRESD